MKEIIFTIITLEEYQSNHWYYSDGSQPIHNGQTGLVVKTTDNFDIKDVLYIITCCSNCGDYTVIDISNVSDDSIRDAVTLKNNSK